MALVQLSGGASTTGSNAVLTFAAPLTAGSASIVVCASWDGGTGLGLASVTGSVNGAYTRAAINPTTANFVEVWYKLGVAAGFETITLAGTAADGNRYQTARAMEWAGVATFDQSGGRLGLLTDGASHYVPAGAPNSTADSLVVGGFAWNAGTAPAVWITGAGETVLRQETDPNTFTAASLTYKTVAAVETSRLSQGLAFVPGPADTVGAVATFSLAAEPIAYTLDVTPAAYDLAAAPVTLVRGYTLDVSPAAYVISAADVTLEATITPPEPTPGGIGFEMGGARFVSRKPLLQRVMEAKAERVRPAKANARKKARVIEVAAAEVALESGDEGHFRALMERWIAQRPVLPESPGIDTYQLFMAQVAMHIERIQEEARRAIEQDEEEALIALLS